MSRLKHFGQLASHRSKNTGLFTNFSQQASSIIKKGDKNLHRCIDKADISLTVGDLVVCNYRAIRAGWDMHEKLWKRVDANFSKINNQLRRSFRSNSRSSDSSITDLRKKNQDLRKESKALKKLVDRQADLITGMQSRLSSLESAVKLNPKQAASKPDAGINYYLNRNYDDIVSNGSQINDIVARLATAESSISSTYSSDTNLDLLAAINALTARVGALEG